MLVKKNYLIKINIFVVVVSGCLRKKILRLKRLLLVIPSFRKRFVLVDYSVTFNAFVISADS